MENGKRRKSFSIIRFPFSVMKRSWFPIIVVVALLGLLGLLATLQYRWLGQISDGERERLQRLVQSDTQRFAEDFNREIQSAYFNFQVPASVWREKNWDAFNKPLAFWRGKTAYPNLVRDFYFAEAGAAQNLFRYNNETGAFEAAAWTEELNNLKPKFADEKSFVPVNTAIPALLMPIHEAEKKIDRIFIRTASPEKTEARLPAPRPDMPERYGVLIIRLDENVIKNQILPDLVKKYFSASESADYSLAVVGDDKQIVFQTGDVKTTDASAALFNLSADNFLFFSNRELLSKIEGEPKTEGEHKNAKVIKKFESKSSTKQMILTTESGGTSQEVELVSNESPQARIRVFEKTGEAGNWILNVQHAAGSLEQFITRTRQKNLAISFGILSLLAISILLIFLSAQRAQRLAQRQLDFVSSVSHEFRTPLAVIYSAGENLTDGVVRNEIQVSQYGNLIKREGKKLRAMVEQILDFAGANSGKKKYDLRDGASVREIVENALAECQPLIDEKEIVLEQEIAENLPPVVADKNALSQAIQNLIGNAVKYSNGEKWVKISAQNGGGKIKIAVEDKGIGISKADLKHILEPFYRAKTVVDEQIHGNGLGLSLVKQIVSAHKGELKIESEPQKGSRFTIELRSEN